MRPRSREGRGGNTELRFSSSSRAFALFALSWSRYSGIDESRLAREETCDRDQGRTAYAVFAARRRATRLRPKASVSVITLLARLGSRTAATRAWRGASPLGPSVAGAFTRACSSRFFA